MQDYRIQTEVIIRSHAELTGFRLLIGTTSDCRKMHFLLTRISRVMCKIRVASNCSSFSCFLLP
jgi:hypothetical protein